MNGPNNLSDKELLSIAKSYKNAKQRRRVYNRVNMLGLVSHSDDDLIEDENEPEGDLIGFELAGTIDSDSFWL